MKLTLREIRACNALLNRPILREQLDSIAGCSNSPELIAGLRRKGLQIICERVERFDRDGKSCYPGVYRLTHDDKQTVRDWLAATTRA